MLKLPFRNEKKQISKLVALSTQVNEHEFQGLKWIDIVKPTEKEIEMLKVKYDFHFLLLEDCMTEHQRSKVDSYDNYTFIVLHLPRYKKDLLRLQTEEIDIFIGPDYLITLHEGELKPLVDISKKCMVDDVQKKKYMENGSALLLYEIVKALLDYCFPMLDKIAHMVDDINREVFVNRSKSTLEAISRTKMQIINFRSVIKPLRPVILTLEREIKRYLPEGMEMYFDDITDKAEKIWDMLENYKEVIESADGTFATLTNHTINGLMRTFTIIQVAILPMTLVSGLFSMNVNGIPFEDLTRAFWVVFAMILVPTMFIACVLFIKRNKWL